MECTGELVKWGGLGEWEEVSLMDCMGSVEWIVCVCWWLVAYGVVQCPSEWWTYHLLPLLCYLSAVAKQG